jgi:hypothetical protein
LYTAAQRRRPRSLSLMDPLLPLRLPAPPAAPMVLWLLLVGLVARRASADFVVYPDTYCGAGANNVGELSSCTCNPKDGACMKVRPHCVLTVT